MHVFQDMPAELIELDPFTRFGTEWALLTSEKNGKANAMTISWGAMGVLFNKNIVTVFVRDSRYTKEFIDDSGIFSVSFFRGKEMNALKYFGMVSGRDEDKFAATRFNVNYHKGIPFIDEASFVIVCKVIAKHRMSEGDFLDPKIKEQFYSGADVNNMHTIYVGEIVEFLAR